MNLGPTWRGHWVIMNNVAKETELYAGMCAWLQHHLKDTYVKQDCKIFVVDSHSVNLDSVLEQYGIIKYYPQVVGLMIEIDVLGMVIWRNKAKIYFIEAKKTPLTLQNLGQLLVYCRLCDPEEAYLLSSHGLGSLKKVLTHLHREDLLDYGDGSTIKKMQVAKWDVLRNTIDSNSIIPKL